MLKFSLGPVKRPLLSDTEHLFRLSALPRLPQVTRQSLIHRQHSVIFDPANEWETVGGSRNRKWSQFTVALEMTDAANAAF